jgi:hypothetical protein
MDASPAGSGTSAETSGNFAALRALGALAAFALAFAAQGMLEETRLTRAEASGAVAPVFLAAGVLAVAATWGRRDRLPGSRPLAIVLPEGRWWWACLPGIGFLALAALFEGRFSHQSVFSFWATGILALLAAGAAHAVATRQRRPLTAPADWPARYIALSYLALAAVALGMRTALDITRLPAFVQADEAAYGVYARDILGRNPFAWFDLYMVGMPNMQLVPFRMAQFVFGDSLWAIRMGGVLMGTLSVLCTFGFARRLIGNLPALTGALLLAVAHTHVHWSRTAQIFIETPAAAAVVLWLFTRAWTGGSLLSWLGAGVALGIGTQTYYASYILPLMLPVTALGWALSARVSWKSVLVMTLTVEVVALLVFAPVGKAMYRRLELAATRPTFLFTLRPENLEGMGDNAIDALLGHAKKTVTMFNTGVDHGSDYAAQRSLVDAVTASMVPVAAAILLARLLTPAAWLCLTWVGAYLAIGVFLTAQPPSYHRIPTVLLFSSIAVAWTVAQLAGTIRERLRLPASTVALVCFAFTLAAGASNAYYYFHEFRLTRPTLHTMGLTRLVCGYAETHTVIDATTLDGREFVPTHNVFLYLECPGAKRIRSDKTASLWNVAALTDDERVVLIVPVEVLKSHPGKPQGYRVTKHFVDENIKYPLPLPLAVYELERERR